MRTTTCAAVVWAALAASSAWAGSATVTVNAAGNGPRVNPRLYGIFLEEINHGVDGGLYAELIANRAFEDSRPPEGCTLRDGRWVSRQGWDSGFRVRPGQVPRWSLVREGAARGEMHLESSGGLNEHTPYCLRLDVEDAAGGRLGVANEGFWGIGVRKGAAYDLSLFARVAGGFTGPLGVRLEDARGQACSNELRLDGLAGDWKRHPGTLTASRDETRARLVVWAAAGKGRVWLDFVSLFPRDTFHGRKNGLRADIAGMIADLKPGFVRFPGGCVVEGGNLATAYDWKLTVGPVEQRPERWNAWNYRRTHGLGLLEYLQFCEDLGADPMWVGFAGQSCLYRHADHVPMGEMGKVVDGFLDIMEYAEGPADSKWGQVRATGGHPAPFRVPYVEIGNENAGREYEARYRLIHPELKKRHPGVVTIADYAIPGAAYDMVDDHFYNSPGWFVANGGLYDGRSRKLPPVYVGEIAVTSGEGGDLKGNLGAALGEGVFLLGAERNADVVKLVSYAPLLAHVEGRSGWHGMIYHDSTRVFGTASYHLWKLFAHHRPDVMVPVDVKYTASGEGTIAGAVGVGTWDTAAEFKDIRVEKDGQMLAAPDLARGDAGWRKEGGRWSVQDGAYRQSEVAVGLSEFGDPSWSDYTLSLKARKLRGAEGFLVVFGRKGEDRMWWNVGGWGNREHGIERNRSPVGPRVPGTIEAGRWYDLKVELKGRRIRCTLDGKLVHDVRAAGGDGVFAGAGWDEKTGELIVKAINTTGEPVRTEFQVKGSAVRPEAKKVVLTGAGSRENNSFREPLRVAPREGRLEGAGEAFTLDLPPHSLTVLRLGTAGK